MDNYQNDIVFDFEEEWKPVLYRPKYEASNWGRIRIKESKIFIKFYKINNYYRANLNGRFLRIHKVIAQTFLGKIPKDNKGRRFSIHHKNHNSLDNRPENLEYLSKEEHWIKHGKKRNKKFF